MSDFAVLMQTEHFVRKGLLYTSISLWKSFMKILLDYSNQLSSVDESKLIQYTDNVRDRAACSET